MEWKTFCAQCNPMYTADNAIIRALENIRKPRRYFSVFEAQVWVFCRYWKESMVKYNSAIDKRNMIPKKTLDLVSASSFRIVTCKITYGMCACLAYLPLRLVECVFLAEWEERECPNISSCCCKSIWQRFRFEKRTSCALVLLSVRYTRSCPFIYTCAQVPIARHYYDTCHKTPKRQKEQATCPNTSIYPSSH